MAQQNPNVGRFFTLTAEKQTVSDKKYEIQKRLGWNQAQENAEYKALDKESMRLYYEKEALTCHVIRHNLKTLGIDDMMVEVELLTNLGTTVGSKRMLLSDACCLRFSGLCKEIGAEAKDMSTQLIICKDSEPIGHVDSDGDFDYEGAPDLRTALAWKIATDGGRHMLIHCNVDQDAERILDTIRYNGVSQDAFFGPYFDVLKRVFVYKNTSRFGDGYCGAATTLWRVATRELFGMQHPGYSFCY